MSVKELGNTSWVPHQFGILDSGLVIEVGQVTGHPHIRIYGVERDHTLTRAYAYIDNSDLSENITTFRLDNAYGRG